MSDALTEKQPLGVGSLLGGTFQLYARNFVPATLLALIPLLVLTALSVLIMGLNAVARSAFDPLQPEEVNMASVVILMIIQVVGYSIATAILVHFSYDVKLGHSKRLGQYVQSAMRNIIPLVVLPIFAYLMISIAMVALLIPGFWLLAVWSVMVPVIVIESAGFGALGRSSQLTKEYRWPVLGFIIILLLITTILSLIVSMVLSFLLSTVGGPIGFLLLQTAASAVIYALLSIGFALLYSRLREIKEGVSVDTLANVFS